MVALEMAALPRNQEVPMSYPNGLFGWADVAVPDTAQAKRFYAGVFGWEAIDSPAGDSMPYTMFALDGQLIAGMGELRQEDIAAGQPPVWSSYIIVDDAADVAERAKSLGASLLMEPMEIPEAGKMFFAIDPVGAAIGFWQAGQHEGAGAFNVPGAMSWNELACRDVEGAKAFYTELLGWGIDVQEFDDFTYTVVNVGERSNGGIYDMTGIVPDEVPAHWFVWFTVDGTDEAVQRARSLGATIPREPWDTMFGRMAVISDPQGPTFGVVTPPANS
jgi:hypothetical protein